MATKFYVDAGGRYIGGFDGVTPPAGAIEVPFPPPHGDFYGWNGSAWVEDADRADREADAGIAASFEGDKINRLLFEINFDQENRLRATEGNGAITKAQYRTALLNRYKTL